MKISKVNSACLSKEVHASNAVLDQCLEFPRLERFLASNSFILNTKLKSTNVG
jgi:hypothetical protein